MVPGYELSVLLASDALRSFLLSRPLQPITGTVLAFCDLASS